MPVKIWEQTERGLQSRIVTSWDTLLTSEEHRESAEELDHILDSVLDSALERVTTTRRRKVPAEFARAWAIGRALADSGVFNAEALSNERKELLWKALAAKCKNRARSSGAIEQRWHNLRPRTAGDPRREGGRLDYFEMCRWLAEQDLPEAVETFGGSVRNAWQMLERPTLRPLPLREALRQWLKSLPSDRRDEIRQPKAFAELMKTLRRRWPDRGPGSAKRPVHYGARALGLELALTLQPLATPTE